MPLAPHSLQCQPPFSPDPTSFLPRLPPTHLTVLPNINQSFFHKTYLRKAPSQCTYKSLLRRFSSRFLLRSFHTSTKQWHVGYFLSSRQMLYYSRILRSVFCWWSSTCPHTAKTNSNRPQGREVTRLKVMYSCLMSRCRWEGRCLRP